MGRMTEPEKADRGDSRGPRHGIDSDNMDYKFVDTVQKRHHRANAIYHPCEAHGEG